MSIWKHSAYCLFFAVVMLLSPREFAMAAENTPSAQEILGRVHAAFPGKPLLLEAQLQTKSSSGEVEETYEAELSYDRGDGTLSATLTLRNAFGTPLERIVAKGIGSGNTVYEYYKGEDLEKAPVPDENEQIQDTDFRWQDLTLSFLWWPGGSVAGKDSLKGRECHVIDIANPDQTAEDLRGARVWIDEEMYVLLRAKFYGADGEMAKRFDVKSFAKSGDLWMVKDIDIRSYPSRHRTSLRVRKVEEIQSEKGETEDEKRQG